MLSLRILLLAAGVTVGLSACSFDQILGKGEVEASPSAESGASAAPAGSSVSQEKTSKAAKQAKAGQYLLCSTTDRYKERVTTYYVCRERRCVGQESPATGVGTLKNKASCLSACRKSETKKKRDASARAYCVG